MSFDALLKEYGWAGVLLFMAAERIFPWARDLTTQERKAELAAKAHERERTAKIEERQIAALEAVSQSLAQMNARNAHMERALEVLTAGMTRLLERMPSHPPGHTGPLPTTSREVSE